MKVENLIVGRRYRQKVDSQQGYEDWEYTGKEIEAPGGKLYAFENDRGVYYFDEQDIEYFEVQKSDFTWQIIKFADGSNPFICMTPRVFKDMMRKYNLVYIAENFWLAK